MTRKVKIIGCAFGYGAQIKETEKGPKAISKLLPPSLSKDYKEILPNPEYSSLARLTDYCKRLAVETSDAIQAGLLPITLGGDHSIAIGSWGGIVKALAADEEFGLIWIDAHMDSHTYESSPSKAYHGMPMAALLGYGDKELLGIAGKLNPGHVCIVGVRSYESAERALLEKLGVRVFYASEVHERGLKAVLKEAKAIAMKAKCGFGVSLDLDFFDPLYAPGVGSPETNGFKPDEFLDALPDLLDSNLKGFEIVELNPDRDVDGKTAAIASKIVMAIF